MFGVKICLIGIAFGCGWLNLRVGEICAVPMFIYTKKCVYIRVYLINDYGIILNFVYPLPIRTQRKRLLSWQFFTCRPELLFTMLTMR